MAAAKTHSLATFEKLAQSLLDDSVRTEYEAQGAQFVPALVPKLLGAFLVWCGNLVYGDEPSYLKFRAVEVIARVPYHSWESAIYTLLTLLYTNEKRALSLVESAKFSRLAQDNETMHVVVISSLVQGGGMRYSVVPVLFAWFYFWASYLLYLLNPRWSFELNVLFEDHAYRQYTRFIEKNGEQLKTLPIDSEFLRRYGRNVRSQLEFFQLVRNDELIHRNQSLHAISSHKQ